jgi:hypothetical protein
MLLTRLEAIKNSALRYRGKVCTKHPALDGERYVKSYGCIACALVAVKKYQRKNLDIVHARNKQYRSNNAEKVSRWHRDWRIENADQDAKRKVEYRLKNADKVKNTYKRYYEENYLRMLAKNNKRHADKLRRTPAWLTSDDWWMIEQAYEIAAKRSKLFGFKWHVDHVLPLRGKSVSGLHTPYNLQVIPAVENLRKSNRV